MWRTSSFVPGSFRVVRGESERYARGVSRGFGVARGGRGAVLIGLRAAVVWMGVKLSGARIGSAYSWGALIGNGVAGVGGKWTQG